MSIHWGQHLVAKNDTKCTNVTLSCKYLTFVTGPTNIWVITDLFKVSKERIIFQMTLVEKKVDLRVEGQFNATKDFR